MKGFMHSAAFVAAATIAATAWVSSAQAQDGDFPSEPIRIINPFSAGGASDTAVRALTAESDRHVDEAVLVENVTGAGGVTGMLRVMDAEPDGHTVLVADTVLVTLPLFQQGLPVNVEQFRPIGVFNVRGAWLLTRPRSGWTSLDDMVEAARERPGEITVGVPSLGSVQEMAVIAIEQSFDIDLNVIPYTGGAPTMAALLGDQIDAAMTGSPAGLDAIKAGEANFIIASTELQIEGLPNELISFTESSIPYDLSIWMALWAPRDTSDERLAELAGIFGPMAESERWNEFARAFGVTPVWMGPEEAAEYIARSAETYGDLAEQMDQ